MKTKKGLIASLYLLIFIVVMISSTSLQYAEPKSESEILCLRWYPSHPAETFQDVRTGFLWSLSYLGAQLPQGSFDNAVHRTDSVHWVVDFSKLGFSEEGLGALKELIAQLKQSEEYKVKKAIDMSRFLVLALHSPWHYYKITGVFPNYKSFEQHYKLEAGNIFGITNSSVGKTHRLLRMGADTTRINQVAFSVSEGKGNLFQQNFKPSEHEVFDIMKNGQLRFAVYDHRGQLASAASSEYSLAGKPSKCMWCHEIVIQTLYSENTEVPGTLSNAQFENLVHKLQEKLYHYRAGLSSEIDFEKKQDHTFAELLYIGFMEPSRYRISQEMDHQQRLLNKVMSLPTHTHEEFPKFGTLYERKAIDKILPYTTLKVPDQIREGGGFEPNYLKRK
ncbi:MAG: hypothetical protein MUF42_12275 [Cytophagaceae bacterium]|jgi:hypothetical protein|nr:hypothetical protein [Cytophagaceae bacterium]